MIKYDKLQDKFIKSGKELKPDSKEFMPGVCEFVISRIERGENLADIVSIESEVYPTLASILSYIDSDTRLSEMRDKAEKSRLAIMKEQLLEIGDIYRKDPSPENKDLFISQEKMYSSLAKQAGQNESVKLIFNSVLPADFWEGEPPAPKNPREEK